MKILSFFFLEVQMNFEENLEKIIREETTKLVARFHLYHNGVHAQYERSKKRRLYAVSCGT